MHLGIATTRLHDDVSFIHWLSATVNTQNKWNQNLNCTQILVVSLFPNLCNDYILMTRSKKPRLWKWNVPREGDVGIKA
jgi:hypothetical protein